MSCIYLPDAPGSLAQICHTNSMSPAQASQARLNDIMANIEAMQPRMPNGLGS